MTCPFGEMKNLLALTRLTVGFATTAAAFTAQSATLATVPMQGTMVMPMIAYHAADGTLSVRMNAVEVQLTPLLVSNPTDQFAPDDPWFADLDPAGRGLSFSRRYGFVMDAMSDPLPAGTAIWLRKVSMSPGLMAWKDRANPKTWAPIFGTAGSPDVYPWDGTMFHPTFGAMPGTNAFSAQFEAFLVNTASEEPLPNGSTGPFTLTFTNTPDARPQLSLAGGQVRWAAAATTNYVLECCEDISTQRWTAVTNGIQHVDTENRIVVDPSLRSCFFRLNWSRP